MVRLKDLFTFTTTVYFFQLLVGIMALLSGILTIMLPETLGRPLTNTLVEATEMGRNKKSCSEKTPPAHSGAASEKIEMFGQERVSTDK